MIYLVRHGEAAAHWGAHPDPGLSELGHQQAADVAARLKALGPIQQVFTSPMQRCVETAQPFATLSGLELQTRPDITEIPTPPALPDRRAWLTELMSGSWNAAPPIVMDWHRQLIRFVQAAPDNSVLFTHFVAINAIAGALTDKDKVRIFSPGHTSITVLKRVDGRLSLDTHENQDAGIIL